MFVLATESSIAQEKHPYYCTISGTYNLAMKIRLELEWGEQKQLVALRNEEGKKIEFNNLTDILNYMSARGWQFVTELDYDGHIHYLLKKDVSSPEEAKQGLRFDTDKEKHHSRSSLHRWVAILLKVTTKNTPKNTAFT